MKFKEILRCLIYYCPTNIFVDSLINYVRYVYKNKTIFVKKKSFNGELLRLKCSRNISSFERKLTSDKELVKYFIAGVIGEQYNVPTIGICKTKSDLEELNIKFPCVIKSTHASGDIMFLESYEDFNPNELLKWLNKNYYRRCRERNYKDLTPKLIVEPLLFNDRNLEDVKFFCVRGEVKLIQVDFDRHTAHTRKLYDADWTDLKSSIGYPLSKKVKSKPSMLDEMKIAASRLAKHFEFVRIDMYYNVGSEKFYVGEITHCHGGAGEQFIPTHCSTKINTILFDD